MVSKHERRKKPLGITTKTFTAIFDKDCKPRIDFDYQESVEKGDSSFFWQHINYKSTKVVTNLCKSYGLDEDTIEALTETVTRPRYFTTKNGMVFILRDVNCCNHDEHSEMISVRVWVDQEKIITFSQYKIKSIDEIIGKLQSGTLKLCRPIECFLEMADDISINIINKVSDIVDSADDLEANVMASDIKDETNLRAAVSFQRREIVSFRRYLMPLQNIFINITNERVDWLIADDKTNIREIYNKMTKAIEDLDYARDHLSVLYEELQTKINVRISKVMYFFSVVTVIFLPLTFITGLLGINVEGIPFAKNEHAFTWVTIALFALCIILWLVLKKRKWV